MEEGTARRRAAGAILGLAALMSLAASATAQVGAREALALHRMVSEWVEGWSAPLEAPADPEGMTGACVTLRFGGQVVGRGTVMAEDGTALLKAARAALAEASAAMPIERDALRRQRLLEMAPTVSVDVQAAGTLIPMQARTLAEAGAGVSPGYHGVAARVGGRIEAVFPGTMLATNTSPTEALASILTTLIGPAAALGDPRTSLSELSEREGLTLYRFEAQHVAQPTPGSAPVFLYRGDRIATLADVAPAKLDALGDAMARHIEGRFFPGDAPLGLLRSYHPWSGEYEEPLIASAFEQGLAALALARWARVNADAHAQAAARRALVELARVHPSEQAAEAELVSAAAFLLAWLELDEAAPNAALASARACAERVAAWAQSEKRRAETAPERAALAAAALAELARRGGPIEVEAEAAESVVREILRRTDIGGLPALMPWILWAEQTLAETEARVKAAAALRSFRDAAWEHQLTPADLGPDGQDLVGGLVFTRGGAALPSWQTLRPLAGLATMLGDPRLTTDEELPMQAGRLLQSLRFARQLAAGEVVAHMYADAERARGGVRLAPWDQRMPLEATSMGLLTIAETLAALERRSGSTAPDR